MADSDLPSEQILQEYRLNIKHQYSELMAIFLVDFPMHEVLMRSSLEAIGLLGKSIDEFNHDKGGKTR